MQARYYSCQECTDNTLTAFDIVCSFSVVLSGLEIALTISSEVQAVQNGIHPLINYALTSNHLSGPVRVNLLDHLE